MAAPFPHHYSVELEAEGPTGTLRHPGRPPIAGGPPPQFGGKEEWWSPEELLLGSVGLCLMTTFQSLASKERLAVQSYGSSVEGTLDKTSGGLAFTAIRVVVKLGVAQADVSRADGLLRTARKLCIISNSLKVPVALEASVSAAG